MVSCGTLYLCATPIGNLEDMTYRAVRVLREVDLIAAEDTRHTRKLLSHFDLHTPLISYHEHNKIQRGPELIERLLAGQNIAVVSDAGMPGISDPGTDLVQSAIQNNIVIIPVPGANAALTALVASGLDTTEFTFIGFLPKKTKNRRELLANLAVTTHTMVFYESPHRLKATLAEMLTAFGDRQAVAARELTKKFEEFVRSTLQDLQQQYLQVDPRGEFTLVVAGCDPAAKLGVSASDTAVSASPQEAVLVLMAGGMQKKDAIRKVALEFGLSKRSVYQSVLASPDPAVDQ